MKADSNALRKAGLKLAAELGIPVKHGKLDERSDEYKFALEHAPRATFLFAKEALNRTASLRP